MFHLVWPKIYFVEGRFQFLGTLSGKAVEWDISEADALGLAESIMAAMKRKSNSHQQSAAA